MCPDSLRKGKKKIGPVIRKSINGIRLAKTLSKIAFCGAPIPHLNSTMRLEVLDFLDYGL